MTIKLIPHEINGYNTFILGWYSDDTSFCDEIISIHKNDSQKDLGMVYSSDGVARVELDIKDSVDSVLTVSDFYKTKYSKVLQQCVNSYITVYPDAVCAGYAIKENIPIQYYPRNGGYKQWHCERRSATLPDSIRHLVFMTYLNDLEDGGTEFLYQNVRIKAQKGLTLIWPSDWTFTHRGQVSETSEKYIITGWLSLVKDGEYESIRKSQNENSSMQ